jgi:hypothetical protein
MNSELLVHQCRMEVTGQHYDVFVYRRPDGSHIAKTFFAPHDVIVNDGPSLDEVLAKHRLLLPLAVNSRQILQEFRNNS